MFDRLSESTAHRGAKGAARNRYFSSLLTGKIIAPELYIAIGIRGAIQHLTRITDAGTIVASNKNADSATSEIADMGLAGDLFKYIRR